MTSRLLRFLAVALLALVAVPAAAQEEIGVAKIYLNGSPTLTSGSGTPESVVTATPGSLFLRTDTGTLYVKSTGTGNTGWVLISLTGSGTANTLAKWTTSSNLGDSVITESSGNLVMTPSGDIVVNPTGNDILPTTGYDINLGSLTTKYLTLHAAELWVETLVAQNTMATIGGRILVAPTTQLTSDLASGATSMVVKHNNLANGDRVYLEANGQVEFIAIGSSASGSGPYTYSSLTRNLDGSGANNWAAGDAVLNTGTTGNGFIDLYSVRGVNSSSEIGPTIVGNVRTGTTYNAWSPRWAVGNLNGLYGYSGSTYGAAFGVPSGARVTVDSTNGIIIYGGDNDPKVTIDTSGNATFDGKLTVGTGRNLIRNSECRVSSEDWNLVHNTGMTTTLTGPAFSPWRLLDESNACYITVSGTPPNATGAAAQLSGQHFAVVPLARYEASAYLGVHGAPTALVQILWYNASNILISSSDGNFCTNALTGGVELDDWCRSGVIGTAPVTAKYADVYISTQYDGTDLNPYLFWVRSYFGEASSTQEDLSEWGPAGITEITNGMIKTDAIDARVITASAITTSELAADSVTSAKIVAGTIVASDIATATITADRLSVSTLDAITANVGTLTGGTIDGVTIKAGSSDEVLMNSSGVSITSGSGGNSYYKFDNSLIGMRYISGQLGLRGGSGVILISDAGADAAWDGSKWFPLSSGRDLGSSSQPWRDLYLSTLAGVGGNHFVCHDNNGKLYSSGSTCDGSPPAPAPAAEAAMNLDALWSEIAELRAAVERLQTSAERKQ